MDRMSELKVRMDALAVFEELKQDDVLSRLLHYLSEPSVAAYSAFVSALYRANGGHLSAYLREVSEICPTPYAKRQACGDPLAECLKNAVDNELITLQRVADLTPQDLTGLLSDCDGLPEFVSGGVDIAKNYYEHVDEIHKFGYGMYAKHRAFFVNGFLNCSDIRNRERRFSTTRKPF